MTYKYGFILTLLLLSVSGNAQDDKMETDRPDQTESVFITKKNYIQAEIGFNIEKDNDLTAILHPTTLLKYGLSKRFEFRLISEFASVETPVMIPFGNDIITGLLPVQIGGKLAISKEKGILPQTALLFHVAPPKLGSKKFHNEKWAPDFRISMQHTLSDDLGLGYNIGAEWDGYSDTPYWIYTIAPGLNIGENWYGYLELFGAFRKDESPQHNIDCGLAVYLNNNFRLDISTGFGLTEPALDWYGAIGFSFRFNTK